MKNEPSFQKTDFKSLGKERKITKPAFPGSLTKFQLFIIFILSCIVELTVFTLAITYIIGLLLASLILFGWPIVVFRFFLAHKNANKKFNEKIVEDFNEETQVNRLKFLYPLGAKSEYYNGIWQNQRNRWQDRWQNQQDQEDQQDIMNN